MTFDRVSVVSRGNGDILAIGAIVEARHKPTELQMAEIVKIAEAYKRSLESVGFGFLLDPNKIR